MYDVSELRPNGKETAALILICVVVLVAIFCAGYMLGLRNSGKDVHDNGNAAQHVREELGSVESNIGAAGSGIDNASAAAGRIEERIDAAQERVDYLKSTAAESRRIIEECQSVLREVRAGGEKDPAPH
jgi:peptidoglycan hydrolase CwlO-like protein